MNLSPTAAIRAADRMRLPSRIPQRRKLLAPQTLTPALRLRIENAIEALLAVLDADDPDPDIEPSFGYLPNGAAADECEADEDLNESEERHIA